MRIVQAFLYLVLFTSMSGCANIASNNLYQPVPGKEPKITFVRNQNQYGSTVITSIRINDWMVGTLAPGEHLTIEYPAGIHQVRVKEVSMPLAFKNNREYFFLIDQKDDGSVNRIRSVLAKEAALHMESGNYHSSR